MTSKVDNRIYHATSDGHVTNKVSIGVVRNQGDKNGLYVHSMIDSPTPASYSDRKKNIAATVAAMRGQYDIVYDQNKGDATKAWNAWHEMAMRLTYSSGQRGVLYKINPINGMLCLVDYWTSSPTNRLSSGMPLLGPKTQNFFTYIQEARFRNDTHAPPYLAFSHNGARITGKLQSGRTLDGVSGVNLPLVDTEHIKHGDTHELNWVNVGLHMVSRFLRYNITQKSMNTDYTSIKDNLINYSDQSPTSAIATQAVAPYPVQWRSNDVALAQAMEIATQKLVGTENFKKHFGLPGDAMNVAMGAAYFCMKPSANQIHLKTMYTQEDRVMPNDSQAFVRDMTGARTKYLEALQGLISGT